MTDPIIPSADDFEADDITQDTDDADGEPELEVTSGEPPADEPEPMTSGGEIEP